MSASDQEQKLSSGQQRVLKLLFKFRFISAQLLAQVMGISRPGVYQALESLVEKGIVSKVYEKEFRINRKPAYYYLNKQGVTTVRKLLNAKEATVHALYKNDVATPEFVDHCLTTTNCYAAISRFLPADTNIFTKSEISRFAEFPKSRPDLYIRMPDGREAIIVIVDDKPLYIVRKRLNEILQHSEDEGWEGDYPCIGFVLRHNNDRNSFLYTTRKKLEEMGVEEGEIRILATHLKTFNGDSDQVWLNPFNSGSFTSLFE